MKTLKVLLFALAALAATRSSGQVTISASPSSYGSGLILSSTSVLGSISAIAQTFQTPTAIDIQLNQLRIFVGSSLSASYLVAIAEWNTDRPAATALWQSSFTTSGTYQANTPVTFNTDKLVLNASSTYAFLVWATDSWPVVNSGLGQGMTVVETTSDFTNGVSLSPTSAAWTYWTLDTSASYDSISSGSWNMASSSQYYSAPLVVAYAGAFDQYGGTNLLAPLTSAPEPSIPGLALGLSGLAGYVAWRRKKAAQVTAAAA